MALAPTNLVISADADFSSDGLSINFEDTTGVESATNLGGYGNSVNPMTSDITASTLTISLPSPDTYQADNNNQFTINSYPTLGNVLDNPFNVANFNLGLANTDKLKDGQYQATYFISGNFSANTFQNSYTFVFYNTAKVDCCLDKKGANFDDLCCNEDNAEFIQYMQMRNIRNQFCNAVECSNEEDALEMLKTLENYCNGCGC
jgi:hypothetical protein